MSFLNSEDKNSQYIQSVYRASEIVLSTSHTRLILRRILRTKCHSYTQTLQTGVPKRREGEWLAQGHKDNTLTIKIWGLKPGQSETRGRVVHLTTKGGSVSFPGGTQLWVPHSRP